ncbi:MAG: hypothetical protein ABIE36_01715 [Candidatus Diapherotrites archaeon]
MKKFTKAIQLICLVLILIITGCAPMKFVDDLSRKINIKSSRGYVVLFCGNEKGNSSYKESISIVKTKREYLFAGNISYKKSKDSYKAGYIIAAFPGPHYVSTSTKDYYFNVEEGMVHPIEISLRVLRYKIMQPWGLVENTDVEIGKFTPGKPISIEEYNMKLRR